MPFSWGAAGRGAGDALQRALAERYAKTQEAERVAREIEREAQQQRNWQATFNQGVSTTAAQAMRQAEQDRIAADERKRIGEERALELSRRNNALGMVQRAATGRQAGTITPYQAAMEAAGQGVNLPDVLTEDSPEEKEKKSRDRFRYEQQTEAEFRARPQGPQPDYEWVKRGDTFVEIPKGRSQPGDVPLSQASKDSKPSSGLEKKTLGFFAAAQQADSELETNEKTIAELSWGGQARLGAPNILQSDIGRSYNQAQRAFMEAHLRRTSGAVITPEEMAEGIKTYFVQPGDSPANIAQKRRARAGRLASLSFESGPALDEYVGSPEEAQRIKDDYKKRAAKTDEPKVGERRRINGRLGEWDGKGWLPVPE